LIDNPVFIAGLFSESTEDTIMRLFKECKLDDVAIDTQFLLDGVWYLACEHDEGSRFVQVQSDMYYTEKEMTEGVQFLQFGDFQRYRNDLVVIVEVTD
jgi:hypothetical protein